MREPGHTRGTSRDVPPVLDPESEDCRAISAVLVRVGDKWTVLVVALLGDGPRRFSALKRQVGGISQRMLTLTLRNLERDGLVIRTVTTGLPAARRLCADPARALIVATRPPPQRLGPRA